MTARNRFRYNLAFFGGLLPVIFVLPALLLGACWLVLRITGDWPELYRVGLYVAGFVWLVRLIFKHQDSIHVWFCRPWPAWWQQEARRPITKAEAFMADMLLHLGAPMALLAVFFWDTGFRGRDAVANWNDGSFGFMSSAHYRDACPGGSGWNDLNWLGAPEGPYPINFYYGLLWILNHPDAVLGTAMLGLIVFGVFRYVRTGRPSL